MEIKVKKTLLATVVTLQLFMAGIAAAHIMDAGHSISKKLEFKGTVLLPEAQWVYEMGADADKLKYIELTEANATTNINHIKWVITPDVPYKIIHGEMARMARVGTPGILPSITAGGTQIGKTSQITLGVKFGDGNDSRAVGTLVIEAENRLAMINKWSFYDDGIPTITTNYNPDQAEADLKGLPEWSKIYDRNTEFQIVKNATKAQFQRNMHTGLFAWILAINDLVFKSITLEADTMALAETWSATLPITVTLQ